MAEIIPFRALRYDPHQVKLEDVLTQPYDKITPEMQAKYYERSSHNLVRIILGKTGETDTDAFNTYTRAKEYFHDWRSSGVLKQDAEPGMIARGGGSVILIASQLGRVASPGRPAYCATKGALIQLAKVLAADHAAQGIRANTISPGAVETRRMLMRHKNMDEARKMMGPKHLLGRLGLPEEIARAAVYLASDASAFMTGSDLLIDGGYTAI